MTSDPPTCAGTAPSRSKSTRGQDGQTARTKSMLGADAQCTVRKQSKAATAGKSDTAKRRRSTGKRNKKAQQISDDEGSDEDEEPDEATVVKRLRSAPRRRLEPMLYNDQE